MQPTVDTRQTPQRFLFLLSGPNVPSSRYRWLIWLSRLRGLGHRCDVALSRPAKYDYWRVIGWRNSQRLKRLIREYHLRLARKRKYDAIVIERELFDTPDASLEAEFRKQTGRLILDLDDAVFLRYPEKMSELATACDRLLAGNREIAQWASEFCKDVRLLPTVVETNGTPQHDHAQLPATPVIGWIGTPSNVEYLAPLLPALRTLNEVRPLVLRIVTSGKNPLAALDTTGVPVELRRWSARTAAREIANFDVGIMPLPTTEWTRYKCGFKLLQYMAAAVPSAASPVGVNREIIEDGANGFLCETPDDWSRALDRLLADPAFRAHLGTAGRLTVEERYSLDSAFPIIAAALTDPTMPLDRRTSAGSVQNSPDD